MGEQKQFRCAVYTRKSSEDGLEQDFNSLEAQREAGEAYIRSQSHEGWKLLPDRFDDGGFSGGNMNRPGLWQFCAINFVNFLCKKFVWNSLGVSRSWLPSLRFLHIHYLPG